MVTGLDIYDNLHYESSMLLTAYSGYYLPYIIDFLTNLPSNSYNKRNMDRFRTYLIKTNNYMCYHMMEESFKENKSYFVNYINQELPNRSVHSLFMKHIMEVNVKNIKELTNKNTSLYKSFKSIFSRLSSQI